MSIGKWLGVGAGWFFGGPIGAIIGYHIGKNFFNGKNDNEKAYEVSLLEISFIGYQTMESTVGSSDAIC